MRTIINTEPDSPVSVFQRVMNNADLSPFGIAMSALRFARRWVLRAIGGLSACVLLYVLTAVVLGVLPVNLGYQAKGQGIRIFLSTNGVHTALIVPLQTRIIDWTRIFPPEQTRAGKMSPAWNAMQVGWGDRAFFLETPEWSDLKVSTALLALSGLDKTVLHVEFLGMPEQESADMIELWLSPEAYRRLAEFIQASAQLDAQGKTQWVRGFGYWQGDAFYEAKGHYSLLRTCNEWTRDALSEAGVRVPWWSPFDKALFWQLRD